MKAQIQSVQFDTKLYCVHKNEIKALLCDINTIEGFVLSINRLKFSI